MLAVFCSALLMVVIVWLWSTALTRHGALSITLSSVAVILSAFVETHRFSGLGFRFYNKQDLLDTIITSIKTSSILVRCVKFKQGGEDWRKVKGNSKWDSP